MSKSMIVLLVILGLIVLGVIGSCSAVVGSYNNMVTLNQSADAAWGQVENVYQRRFDLIPNMVESVKKYLNYEHDTFKDVAEARQQVNNLKLSNDQIAVANSPELQKQFLDAQQNLGSALSRLMVVVEKYPDLKGNTIMTGFMDEQAGTENRVAVERKRFQEAVQSYNTAIKVFPSNIIAGMFGFKERAYYKAEQGAEKAPKVKFD